MISHSSLSSEPLWRREAAVGRLSPPAADGSLVDLAVIGGGLTGLSAAYHVLLEHPWAKVTVLEAGQVGHGASTRNTGMLTPGVGQNLASLVSRYGADTAADMYRASLEAVEYVAALAHREQFDADLNMTGQLIVARGPAGRKRLRKQAALMELLGLPCQRLDSRQLATRIRLGGLSPEHDASGPAALRLPIAGLLHPGKLVAGLAAAVRRRQGAIEEHVRVASYHEPPPSESESPVELKLSDGRILRARQLVLATSGYSAPLGVHRGRLLPLHLRVMLTEPLSDEQLTSLGWQGREGVIDSRRVFNYFRLTEDNALLLGGGRPRYRWGGDPADLPAEGVDLKRLGRDFAELFPGLADVAIRASWSGAIAYSLDGLPTIGPASKSGRVWFVGGWCGHGLALSVSSGRWLERRMFQGSQAPSAPWFRSQPPAVPGEAARWLGVRAGGLAMQYLDHLS